MNDTLKTIAVRYSCRAFDGRAVERDKLEAIALAAVQSPSAMNRQPWRVVVVGKETVDAMNADGMAALEAADDKTTYNRIMSRGGTMFYNAPAMFIILKQGTGAVGITSDLDIGIVTENIALAATSLGLANVIVGMARIPLDGANGAMWRERFGISGEWQFGMGVLVGYAAADGAPHEPDLSKITYLI